MANKYAHVSVNGDRAFYDSLEVYDKATAQTLAAFIAATDTAIAAIRNAVANKAPVIMAADIAARDALTVATDNIVSGALCFVQNASGDATVESGWAEYVATVTQGTNAITWTKLAEGEQLDVVLDWSGIQNKPASAVADIDDAVTKKHEHANSAVLANIGTNATSGNLTYNGVELTGETGIATGASLAAATTYTAKVQIVLEDM